MRLKQKLIVIFLLVSFVPLLTVGVVAYQRAKQVEVRSTLIRLESFANQREKQISVLLKIYQERARLLSTGTAIGRNLGTNNQTPSAESVRQIEAIIAAQKASLPDLKDITVLDAAGGVVSSTDASLVGANQSNDPIINKARTAVSQPDVVKDASGNVVVVVAAPIQSGSAAGVLKISFTTEEIFKTTQDYQSLGETGEPYLAKRDENGDSVSITPLRSTPKDVLNIRVSKGEMKRPVTLALAKQESVFTDTVDYRGIPVLAATRYLEGPDWGLVVKVDKAEAFASLNEFRNLLAVLFMVSSVLLVGLILLLMRSITRPLLRLTTVTSRISDGQLSERADISSNDEIGELGKSFNQMADRLQRSQKSLAKDVTAKTKELSGKVQELEQTKKAMLNVLEDLRAEKEQVLEEKAKDDAFLQAIGDGLVVTDQEGKIVLVNQSAKEMFGWERKSMLGTQMLKAADLEDQRGRILPDEDQPLTQVLSGKKKNLSTTLYIRKDGERFPVDITITPIVVGKKNIGTVAIYRDVAEREEIQQMQKEFVSIASHELRTPITALTGYLSLVKSDNPAEFEKTKHFLGRAYAAAGRLSELIEDLLSVARLEEGRTSLNLQSINPSTTVTEVVTRLDPKIKEKNLRFTFDNRLKTSDRISCDTGKLEQIMVNLIDNAIKYTPVAGRVAVECMATKTAITITIADTGIGIHQDNQEKIFDKFFREYTELSVSAGGTGLGLFITRELIELMDGRLSIDSVQGEGTTVRVCFPRVKPSSANPT